MKIAETLVGVYIDILREKFTHIQVHLCQSNFLKLLGFIGGANKRINIIKIEQMNF